MEKNTPPVIKPMQFSGLALPVSRVMPNSIPLYIIGNDDRGVVRLEFVFKGGYGIQQKPLQATFTNRMLREGAAGYSSDEISQKLDYYGAWIETYSSQNANHITLYSLSKYIVPLLQLLSAIIKQPTFPADNLETVRRSGLAAYEVASQKVDVVSQRYFEKCLWGEGNPLGHVVLAQDYRNITVGDLQNYYNSVYSSNNCTVFLSGTVDEKVITALEKTFGSDEWGGGCAMDMQFAKAYSSEFGRCNVKLDNTLQSAVKVGFMALDSTSPDYHKLRFLTVLLGGYFGSRLMSNIREENGFTYHIWAELDTYGDKCAFMISSEMATEYVEPCLAEIYKEIERLKNEPIEVEEIEHGRNYILGEMCREVEGVSARAEVFVNAWLSGEGFEGVNEYLKVVESVTPDELMEVARKYFCNDKMIEVVVGNN